MKRLLTFLLVVSMTLLLIPSTALQIEAATYTCKNAAAILDTIATTYSVELSNAIADLFYASDYSDITDNNGTLRNYYTKNSKSWPITNADSYGTSVYDRGKQVRWNWPSKGCYSYACFFEYCVYGTVGTQSNKSGVTVALSKNDASTWQELKEFLLNYVQPGEHFRIDGKHSVIFLCMGTENGKEGFYIAEYWGGGKKVNDTYNFNISNDQYYIRFWSFEDFTKKYLGKTCFVFNAYETSDYVNLLPSPTPPAETSRDIALVLDVSSSMYGEKLDNTKTAAKKFVEQILDGTHNTKISLITYSNYSSNIQDLTDDKALLIAAIDSLYDENMTNIYDGLSTAGTVLSNGTGEKKSIVIMTDGMANRGTTASSGYVLTEEGVEIYLDRYASAIYNLSNEYKSQGYTIYSLGFGLDDNSDEYNLIKYIASLDKTGQRYFWSVTDDNIDDLVFTYEDIAGTISSKKSIVISIECPVDVQVSLYGETLSRNNPITSFGKLIVTDAPDGYNYLFELDDNPDYAILITGLSNGIMNLRVTYIQGDSEHFREFKGVPIFVGSSITTSGTDRRADFALYVDNDNDGVLDSAWCAGVDETVVAASDDFLDTLNNPTDDDFDESEESNTDNGNYEVPTHTHNFMGWQFDETSHWAYCVGCGLRINIEQHNLIDGRCSICGYVAEVNVTIEVVDENQTIDIDTPTEGKYIEDEEENITN